MREKFIIRQINPLWAEEAEEAGVKRRDFHRERNSKRHWYDSEKGEYTDEIYGNLAQIAFREFLKENYGDQDLDFAPLFTENMKSLPDYDARIGKARVEVKGIPPDTDEPDKRKIIRKRLMVKKSEFKNLDYYAAIKFWSKTEYSLCGYAKGSEILAAPLQNWGYAPAYCLFLDNLPHQFKLCPNV
jgi:hypothetical protein